MIYFIHTADPIYPTYTPELDATIPESNLRYTSPDSMDLFDKFGGVNITTDYGVAHRYALYKMLGSDRNSKHHHIMDYGGKFTDLGAIIHINIPMQDEEENPYKTDQDVDMVEGALQRVILNFINDLLYEYSETDSEGDVLDRLDNLISKDTSNHKTELSPIYDEFLGNLYTTISTFPDRDCENVSTFTPAPGTHIDNEFSVVTMEDAESLIDQIVWLVVENIKQFPYNVWESVVRQDVMPIISELLEESMAQTIYGDTIPDGWIKKVDIISQNNEVSTGWENPVYKDIEVTTYYHGTTLSCAKRILNNFGSEGWDFDTYITFVNTEEENIYDSWATEQLNGQLMLDILVHNEDMKYKPYSEERKNIVDKYFDAMNMRYWDELYRGTDNDNVLEGLVNMRVSIINRFPELITYIGQKLRDEDPGASGFEWLLALIPEISNTAMKYWYILADDYDEKETIVEEALQFSNHYKVFLQYVLSIETNNSIIDTIHDNLR